MNYGWNQFGLNFLMFVKEYLTWEAAKKKCKQFGGNLASIKTYAENIFIFVIIREDRAWVGGNNLNDHNTWIWTYNTQFDYKNRHPDEPNMLEGNKRYLNIGKRKNHNRN